MTLEQLKAAIQAVAALNDPDVQWEANGVFGQSGPEVSIELASLHRLEVVYVHEGMLQDNPCLCVKRYFRHAPLESTPEIILPQEIVRWHYALPPWGHPADLPPLDVAVCMQRLPDSAFPKPGEELEMEGHSGLCAYREDGNVRVGNVEYPLWRVLQKLGRIP